MIDEHRQDLAAEYALDALDPESTRAFEVMLANDAELKTFADGLRETAAMLAHDASAHLPPPELRERILVRIRAEAEAATQAPAPPVAVEVATPVPASGGRNILPWTLAACFAISTVAFWTERNQWREEALSSQKDAVVLRTRDALAKVRIAMLAAQVDAFSKSSAVIVWDPEKQRGVVKLANVPRPEAGKDYQLWVIDPKYPQPVSGGLIPVDAEGLARVSFTPDKPISKADKFAISVEPAGGVPQATGPIILLGGN